MNHETPNLHATIKRRIREFYRRLNRRQFGRCYSLIDPRLRDNPGTVTLFQYEKALGEFLDQIGEVQIREITIHGVHLNEPSKLYEGRDFALCKVVWQDSAGEEHSFSERWVHVESKWYNRSTGLLVPVAAKKSPANSERPATTKK